MLSIGKLVSARYYLDSVAKRIEDYYAGVGEAPGVWLGRAAAELGLGGEVAEGDLEPLLAGHAPDGTALVSGKAAAPGRLPGFDLTFSAPKSVTLLFALGDPAVAAAARAAHDQAVRDALGYLEDTAIRVRRGKDGATVLRGEGMVAAGFRHRTSRAGDPQLHCAHVLVMNLSQGPDGRWSALDGTALYAHARTAGFLYQAALRAELTASLGVGWGPVQRGVAEVAGFTKAELGEFSRRRAEIDARMATLGTTSPRAAQAATLDTRQAKKPARRIDLAPLDQVNAKDYDVEPRALLEEWRRRAETIGLDPGVIAARTGPGRAPVPLPVDEAQAWLLSPEGLTAHASTFDRRDVLRGLAERAPEGATIAELETAADRVVGARGVVRLEAGTGGQRVRRADHKLVPVAAGVRYTTADLLAVETALLDDARGRGEAGVGIARPAEVAKALAARPSLSDEQTEMVTRLVTSGAGVDVVIGAAGTGKTFGLDGARAAWQACGMTVIGATLSARAAAQLQAGSGIDSTTIARVLADVSGPNGRLPRGCVVVVDEAAMVGTRTLARLSALTTEADGKLVLVGDPAQLPEIDAGGTFRALAERLGAVRLGDNRRQCEVWERAALADLRAGRVDAAVVAYDEHHRVHLAPTAETAMVAMAADWWAARQTGSHAIMIASRRATITQLNRLARAMRVEAGQLGDSHLSVGEHNFAVGDEVIGLRNDRRLGILNGDVATVTGIDPDQQTVTVALHRSGRNGTARQVVLPAGYTERHLDHAYAMTAYKAQGLTVDRTFSLGDDTLNAQVGYTTLSRGKTANDLYWVAPEPAEAVHARSDPHWELARALATSRTQTTATAMLGDVGVLAATRTLRDLEMEHMMLGAKLRRDMPADVSSELAAARRTITDAQHQLVAAAAEQRRATDRLAETPAWRRGDRAARRSQLQVADTKGSDWQQRLDRAQGEVSRLEAAQSRRQDWIGQNTPALTRHAQLGAAITARTNNLVTTAAVRPPPWLTASIGAYPDTPAQRRAWRHDARLILAVRDRTGGTDPTRALRGNPHPGVNLAGVDVGRRRAQQRDRYTSNQEVHPTGHPPDRGGPDLGR